MAMLSGLVGVIDADRNFVEARDLGPTAVPVKTEFVLPLVDTYPALPADARYGDPVITVGAQSITRVYPVLPPDPANFPLSDRQLRLGLVANGIPLAAITDAIAAIPDATQRTIAEIWWERSIVIDWSHPMTQTLIALVGLTETQAAAMWLAAKDLEA